MPNEQDQSHRRTEARLREDLVRQSATARELLLSRELLRWNQLPEGYEQVVFGIQKKVPGNEPDMATYAGVQRRRDGIIEVRFSRGGVSTDIRWEDEPSKVVAYYVQEPLATGVSHYLLNPQTRREERRTGFYFGSVQLINGQMGALRITYPGEVNPPATEVMLSTQGLQISPTSVLVSERYFDGNPRKDSLAIDFTQRIL